jgi:nicotinamidase-related amidase
MNQINQHIAIYYDQHAPTGAQCARLIETFQAKAWSCVYIQDEHSSASIQAGLQSAFKPLALQKQTAQLKPSIALSSQYGFQNAPVRVAPIMAAFRSELNAALECDRAELFDSWSYSECFGGDAAKLRCAKLEYPNFFGGDAACWFESWDSDGSYAAVGWRDGYASRFWLLF